MAAKKKTQPALQALELAEQHLQRVLSASAGGPDWANLTMYGLYAVEAAVEASSLHFQLPFRPTHPDKAAIAEVLHAQHGLPDVSDLLPILNDARKAEGYGDVEFPDDLDADEVASQIEAFVEAVAGVIRP